MLFDTHTHVNFAAFSAKGGSASGGKDDRDETIKRALSENVWMINVGTQADTSKDALDLASKYPEGVFAAIGLHPVHTWQQMLDEEESHFKTREEVFDADIYGQMLTDAENKVVAVGECGLDYFRLPEENREEAIRKQKTEFIKQINFAKKHKLPLIIHCRDAYNDLREVLKAEYSGLPAVIHSFTDTWETAKKFLDQGYYIALNGILTFDKTGRLAEVAKNTPSDRILTETDAPYLTPPPNRGKRNEPSYVKYVAEKIAEIRGVNFEEAANQTFENACKLFGIKNG